MEGLRCEGDDGYFTSKAVKILTLSFVEFESYHSSCLLSKVGEMWVNSFFNHRGDLLSA